MQHTRKRIKGRSDFVVIVSCVAVNIVVKLLVKKINMQIEI